jgi:hypothetical protein
MKNGIIRNESERKRERDRERGEIVGESTPARSFSW